MRTNEAAKYLQINKYTLLRYARENKIKSYRLSERVIVFKKSDLDEFVNKGE